MFNKINVWKIIAGHLRTLRYATQSYKRNWWDITLFYMLPMLLACLSFYCGLIINKEALTIIATVAVTFMALMFSMLILVLDRYQSIQKSLLHKENLSSQTESDEIRVVVLKELYYNISYSIVIAPILALFSVIIAALISDSANNLTVLTKILSAIVVFLGVNLTLTILMIVKRVYDIFNIEPSEDETTCED